MPPADRTPLPNGDTPDGTVTPDSEKTDTVEENYEEIFVRDDGFEFSSEKGITEYAPTAEYQAPEVPVEYVSDEYLASIDEKADAMRESILNTKDGALRPDDGCYGFYVSESGDDSNTGLTPSSAWKTLKNVNNSPLLKPGTVVYFERGGVWRGQLVAKDGVTYTAYGEGKSRVSTALPKTVRMRRSGFSIMRTRSRERKSGNIQTR